MSTNAYSAYFSWKKNGGHPRNSQGDHVAMLAGAEVAMRLFGDSGSGGGAGGRWSATVWVDGAKVYQGEGLSGGFRKAVETAKERTRQAVADQRGDVPPPPAI